MRTVIDRPGTIVTPPPLIEPVHDTGPNPTAAAVLGLLQHRADPPGVSYVAVHGELDTAIRQRSRQAARHVVGAHRPGPGHDRCPVLVLGAAPVAGPVVVAVDDDEHAEELVAYAAGQAARIGAVLRAVHVWQGAAGAGVTAADRLLGRLLHTSAPGGRRERQVLHDDDPAGALATLSRSAGLLVIGNHTRPPAAPQPLGTVTAALLGRASCPLAVVPL